MSFLSDLIRFESSGSNVTNTNQSTSSGRARGYFQITDGTWQDFGRRAGIDFSRYPTALSAPYHLQAQVASLIPLKRWDPITLRKLSAAGHKFDVNKTLGENLSALGENLAAGEKGAPLPAASAVVTGAGQPKLDYASPETPVPGATQPNAGPGVGPDLASVFSNALGGSGAGDASLGGGGSSGGGSLPPGEAFGLSYQSASDALPPSPDPAMTPLADLFTLPTIGQPESKLKSLRAAQAGLT
jgi:hypothetical protein